MVADDWLRNPGWDDAERADFEMRLARVRRRNRQQYLRIKGLSLLAVRQTDGALELLERAASFPGGYLFKRSRPGWPQGIMR